MSVLAVQSSAGKPQRLLWLYSSLASETLAEGMREHFQTQFY